MLCTDCFVTMELTGRIKILNNRKKITQSGKMNEYYNKIDLNS